jgi:Gly-Xaa carboxypeptidase
LNNTFGTDDFRIRAIDWLGGAVRVPTESYDSMDPVGVDPRWDAFGPFHDYLLKAFPLVHSNLKLTKVNTYGLVFHWQGSDTGLNPILLAAHQDVVPVHPSTVDQWTHPPYSGYFDGTKIWGRGSSDDKSGLIGIMASIESLLENNFEPTRSVVLAFGFDEEVGGLFGAAELAKYLLSTYGKNGFALLVDEGAGFAVKLGGVIAAVGIAEKGSANILIDVASPGGHSSLPPAHTSIGILSALLVEYESNPFEVHIARNTPVYRTLHCLAEHAPLLSPKVKKAVKMSVHSDKALNEVEAYFFQDPNFKSLAGTTQAIDLIGGGVKANALPEKAWAVVNHRIATESSLTALESRDTELLKSLASKFNLSYSAFGVNLTDKDAPAYGTLTLSNAFHGGLEPAPITPTDEEPYKLLSGTIRATYNARRPLQRDIITIAPSIMSGNTDTRYYWDLTKHIFRYNHHNQGDGTALGNVHTVNESIDVDSFLEMILYFTTLILNADESVTMP